MSIIHHFTNLYGEDECVKILNYMIDNDIFIEFNKVKNNYNDLFYFGIKYGILEIVRFLYEKIGVEYDHDFILGFDTVVKSNINMPTNAIPISTDSTNTKMTIQIQDKFSEGRNKCINYLINMKKYSKNRYENKKFYYQFNKKYAELLSR